MKPRARYAEVDTCRGWVLIEDVGHSEGRPTVTNDADAVVRELAAGGKLPPGRRLFYLDSDRELGELLHDGKGRLLGFGIASVDDLA